MYKLEQDDGYLEENEYRAVIVVYLFVLDDSFTSYIFTMRTEQLN